jgi:glucose-1-phosphate thymidylyltransferase
VVIGPGTHITDSFVGPFSSIGAGTHIADSTLQHTVMFEGCRITGVNRIEDSLLGRNVVVRSNGTNTLLRLSLGDDSEVEI